MIKLSVATRLCCTRASGAKQKCAERQSEPDHERSGEELFAIARPGGGIDLLLSRLGLGIQREGGRSDCHTLEQI